MTALTVVACALFVRLGVWQWDKGVARQAEWSAFARGADRAVPVDAGGIEGLPRFQRVQLAGRFHREHQFLLDNRTHLGQAGYEVLTPLELGDGRVVLVDRGWVPFTGSRARLPDVRIAADAKLQLAGRVDGLPSGGLALGRTAPPPGPAWPKVTAYPTLAQLATALGRPLVGRVVLLDPGSPEGYVRDWQPPGLPPARHLAYAIQWWGFALTLLVIWAVLSSPRTDAVLRPARGRP
jgi:cytochrome oxidase assembly protein ShyY1